MKLSRFDEKHVRCRDRYGGTHEGVADYYGADYCLHEFGRSEDAVIVNGYLIFRTQIASIKEIAVHGCVELRTERLILRKCRTEDAESLYRSFGKDAEAVRYTGWNPYATLESAQKTVQEHIENCGSGHFYSWIMDVDDVLVGTIGAYDFTGDRIEVGFSVAEGWRNRGLATEALKKVLEYLTENEGISCVTAWCAGENAGSRKVLEKAGMEPAGSEKDGLMIGGCVYDRLIYEYRNRRSDRSPRADG